MIPAFSAVFDEVSDDQGSADNQGVVRTYQIVPYDSTTWFNEIPMHSHVFVRMVSKIKIDPKEADYHIHGPHTNAYYALTPAQLCEVLWKESMARHNRGEPPYMPYEAVRGWCYVGNNLSPPGTEARGQNVRRLPGTRTINVEMRTARPMDNYWKDAVGTENITWVFKRVHTSLVNNFVVGPNDVRTASHTDKNGKTLETCVQVVAMRSKTRLLPSIALMTSPGQVHAEQKLMGMGVHVPVGLMTYNKFAPIAERDDQKWTVDGVVCADDMKAANEHVQALTLAV